jgi:hypothetical protein
MNEKIKELAEQAGLDMTYPHCIEGDIDELARFAELVLKESTLREISDIGQGAHTDHPMRHWDRTCPACVTEQYMSTKPKSIDTSIHEEIERLKAEIKRLNELADYRLRLLMQMPENKSWGGLDVDDIDAIQVKVLSGGLGIELTNFARAIEAKLQEKNT